MREKSMMRKVNISQGLLRGSEEREKNSGASMS